MMDFSDITRSGTAPPSKPKPYFTGLVNLGARPKTRAVDNDIQDTNSELRVNRVKAPGQQYNRDAGPNEVMETVISSLSENGEADGAGGGAKRAPSRGRTSKDPKRTGQNNLVSGLSAYTQNIPNIVLNASKKANKPNSAFSPRTAGKEHKNINQINELRAAYGADILLGRGERPALPARPKSMKTQGQSGLDRPPVAEHGERRNRSAKVKESGNLFHIPTSSGHSPSPEPLVPPLSSNSGNISCGSDSDSKPRDSKRMKNSSSAKSLLKTTFGAKSTSTMPEHSESEALFSISSVMDPISVPVLVPAAPAAAAATAKAQASASVSMEQAFFPSSSKRGQPDRKAEQQWQADAGEGGSWFTDRDHDHDAHDEQQVEDEADYYIDESDGEGDLTGRRGNSTNAGAPSEEQDDSRPQSRKLYLGTEKPDKPVNKAPRSAGARYGHISPMLGGVDLSVPEHLHSNGPLSANVRLKKNGSHADIQKSHHWLGTEDALEQRPPSRQSSAFPVHLADAPAHVQAVVVPSPRAPNGKTPTKHKGMEELDMLDAPSSPVKPNIEPKSIKKARSEEDKVHRPPSRQKVGAQNLFDGLHDKEEVRRSVTPADSSKPSSSTRMRTSTRSGSRSGLVYDSSRDGFTELDPSEAASPFLITVSYGAEDRKPAAATGYTQSNYDEDDHLFEQFNDMSIRKPSGNSPVLGQTMGLMKSSLPSPVRPKTVAASEPTASSFTNGRPGRITRLPGPSIGLPETEQLRSKSANNYLANHALASHGPSHGYHGHNDHSHHGNVMGAYAKASYLDAGGGPAASVGAWSEGYEHNVYPRAQVCHPLMRLLHASDRSCCRIPMGWVRTAGGHRRRCWRRPPAMRSQHLIRFTRITPQGSTTVAVQTARTISQC